MNKKILTDRKFWEKYWENFVPVKDNFPFFGNIVTDWIVGDKSLIEIGGFPGKYTAWFAKEKKYKVTLLDFFIIPKVVNEIEKIYDIPINSINLVECDFLKCEHHQKYDFVFSAGFIEHFDDTKIIVKKHVNLLNATGNLLITLPNFRGINGFVQRVFDPDNYSVHNIACMDINLLKNICIELGLSDVNVFYYGKPTLWIEDKKKINKYINKIITFLGKILGKIIPSIFSNNKVFAPFIVVKAKKS